MNLNSPEISLSLSATIYLKEKAEKIEKQITSRNL